MARLILEICVDSIRSAMNAEMAGANRIEICEALDLGGLTPSIGLLAIVRQKVKVPIYMMVRPRSGNFCYSREEVNLMLKDIAIGLSIGVDGFVTGALCDDNTVDDMVCEQLIRAAKGKPVTFSRAFDLTCDSKKALNQIIKLGFTRILTSGHARSAPEGLENIRKLIAWADSRIIILPGCGINKSNIKEVAVASMAKEFHSSGRPKKFEKSEVVPLTEGTDLYQLADMTLITSMRIALDNVCFC